MGTERDLIWGSERTMQCADDVLLTCTLETCMLLLTSVTLINSIKNTGDLLLRKTGRRGIGGGRVVSATVGPHFRGATSGASRKLCLFLRQRMIAFSRLTASGSPVIYVFWPLLNFCL